MPTGNWLKLLVIQGIVLLSGMLINAQEPAAVAGDPLASESSGLVGSWGSHPSGKCKDGKTGLVCSGKGKLVVLNTGVALSAPTTVTFYLSASCVPQIGDLQLGATVNLKAIKPGKTGKATMKATLPVGLDPMGMSIVAVIGPSADSNTVCFTLVE